MTDETSSQRASGRLARLPILIILLAAGIGAVALRDQLSFAQLAQHHDTLLMWRDSQYALTVAGFLLAYVAVVGLSLPGATVFTLAGGFMFGVFPGVVFNVVAATTGACLIFLAARSGFGARLSARLAQGGGAAARLQAALQRNELSVLLIMRLVPVVPFVLANLIPACLGVRLGRFALTTAVGILPATLIFTSVGAGLADVFAAGTQPDLAVLLKPQVLLPLLGLALLAALPLFVAPLRRVR